MKYLQTLLLVGGLSGCALHHPPRAPRATDLATLDLVRPYEGAEKIYVEVFLEDGRPALFLVDTGAGISVITNSLAERLGVVGKPQPGTLQGLSGEVPFVAGTLESLSLGGLELENVDVAIGVPGIPEITGWMEVGGILGNNVWGELAIAIDYPADEMVVARSGMIPLPEGASQMSFTGNHLLVEAEIDFGEEQEEGEMRRVTLELDTGRDRGRKRRSHCRGDGRRVMRCG